MPPPNTSSLSLLRETRVIFVEDDASLREVVGRHRARRGYRVETAVDGAEGLQKITAAAADGDSAFDLLITDLKMPRLDGIGLVRELRKADLPIRIIACSSTFTQTSLEELQSLAVDATLPKGAMSEVLVKLVEEVLF